MHRRAAGNIRQLHHDCLHGAGEAARPCLDSWNLARYLNLNFKLSISYDWPCSAVPTKRRRNILKI